MNRISNRLVLAVIFTAIHGAAIVKADQIKDWMRSLPKPTPVASQSPETDVQSLLQPITDPTIFKHLARYVMRHKIDKYPIVVVDLDDKSAWINLNGKIVEMPLLKSIGDRSDKEKAQFVRIFGADKIKLEIHYEVKYSFTFHGECDRTEYSLELRLDADGQLEKIIPESYGEGC